MSGAVETPKFDASILKNAQGILKDLLKNLPPVVTCLVGATWTITSVGDLGVDIDGVSSVPFGVTVCLDRTCTETVMGAGGLDTVGTIAALVGLGNSVPAAVAALGMAAAVASVVTSACVLLIALIALLLVHLVIVAGQILIYNLAGMIPNGVCITHPSLPVVAAAALSPLLGLLAVGNTPLVVTPA